MNNNFYNESMEDLVCLRVRIIHVWWRYRDPPIKMDGITLHFLLWLGWEQVFLLFTEMENLVISTEVSDNSDSNSSTNKQPPAKKRKYVRKGKVIKNISKRVSSRAPRRPQRFGKRISTQNHDAFFSTETDSNSKSSTSESENATEANVPPLDKSAEENQSILSLAVESVEQSSYRLSRFQFNVEIK